jgi:hypothetical protein
MPFLSTSVSNLVSNRKTKLTTKNEINTMSSSLSSLSRENLNYDDEKSQFEPDLDVSSLKKSISLDNNNNNNNNDKSQKNTFSPIDSTSSVVDVDLKIQSSPIISSSSSSSSSSASSTSSSSSTSASASASSASSTQHQQNYKFIIDAFVNGFAQLKVCADKIDYEYIIEIYWSNDQKTFIKRTFDDFHNFDSKLCEAFAHFFADCKKSNQQQQQQHQQQRHLKSKILNNNKKVLNIFDESFIMPIFPSKPATFYY